MTANSLNDTITAITTPLGTGGVAVIRISGDESLKVVSKIFSTKPQEKTLPDFKPNKVYHGWILNNESLIDEVIVLYFKAPNSYTGEDVVEIQGHGGINVVTNILNLCLKSGARLATKGEFTKRAFLNGKMDLSRAEAVLDLIHSKTDKFTEISAHNLSGRLSQSINEIRSEIIEVLSRITASLDFPDEVEEPEYSYITEKTQHAISAIDKILGTAKSSNLMRQGIKIALAGKPNVGKSSLFNAILNLDRAIVTDIPGTTRDVIQETIDIAGIPATLIDTAGIRELELSHDSDYIESIGINVSKNYIKDADIVLLIQDLSKQEDIDDPEILEGIEGKPVLKIGSKADLINEQKYTDLIPVSSKTKHGLSTLIKKIEEIVLSKDTTNGEFSTNLRHQECLNKAKASLQNVLNACKMKELQDFISIDLKSAVIALGEITGEVVTDEIIDNIFSSFCIGK